jgi:hypothetical protein
MVSFWISVRSVSGGEFTGSIGRPRYLKVPDGEVAAPHHEIARTEWLKEVIASFPLYPSPATGKPVPTGDIAFLVHGYNSGVADVEGARNALRKGLVANGFPCSVIPFDWPSGQTAIAYLSDLDHARQTAVILVNAGIKLLIAAMVKDCNIRIHALGHSMGAFVIREAFDHADDGASTATVWTANQLVLFAGDVDARSFSASNTETESTYRHCYRLTNYFSGHDEVLQISNVKRIGLDPRLGRVGLPSDAPSKAVNVDCSAYFEATYGGQSGTPGYLSLTHHWYFSDPLFHKDLAITLLGTIDREKIPTRGPGPGRDQILSGPRPQPAIVARQ